MQGVSEKTEEALSFSHCHGLVAHQPLGGVSRARERACEFSAAYRGRFNGCPIDEPRRSRNSEGERPVGEQQGASRKPMPIGGKIPDDRSRYAPSDRQPGLDR